MQISFFHLSRLAQALRQTVFTTSAVRGVPLLAAAASCVCMNLAHAQAFPDAANAASRQAEILQKQQQEQIQRDIESARPLERREPGIDTDKLVPKVDASAAGPSCRQITHIAIEGAPLLPNAVRQQVASKYEGSCLGVSEIEQLLGLITKSYVDHGYITTRAYLPQQDLKSGELQILVIEGRIEKISVDDGGRHSINVHTTIPAAVGEVFNLRDFEQGVEQINRLASNDARLDVQPGSTAGVSDVVIHNEPTLPFHASLSADNQGSRSTGRNQIGVTASTEHLLGLNELLIYTHRQSQPNDQFSRYSDSDSFSAIIPFGYSTVTYSHSRSAYVSSLLAPSGLTLHFSGDVSSDAVRMDRVLYRNQNTRFSMSGGLTGKESNNYLEGQFLQVSSRKLVIGDIGASLTTSFLGGVLTLDAGAGRGLDMAGALKDSDGIPNTAPKAQFTKFTYGAGYVFPFTLGHLDGSFSTQLVGQVAPNTLYGSEQLLIGGSYTVRGFLDTTLSGDDGYYVRNEVSLRPRLQLGDQMIQLRTYAGIDFGRVHNRVANVPEGRLSGAAIGVAAYWKSCNVDLSYARPLQMPASVPREKGQLWFRVTIGV